MILKLKTAALAVAATATLAGAMPASAQSGYYGYENGSTYNQSSWNHGDRGRHRGWDKGERGYRGSYDNRGYDNRGYDNGSYNNGYNQQTWRGDDGRYYCRRNDGTTGLLIGGAAGAVIGSGIAGRGGDRTLGAILGAGVGALLGRQVDKGSSSSCR